MPEVSASPADELQMQETVAINEWLTEYGTNGAMRVTLERKFPRSYQGVQVSGKLGTYDEPITEEQIMGEHGGGKFTLKVQNQVKNKNGAPVWRFAGQRTFEIAGTPKVDGIMFGQEAAAPSNGSAAAPGNGEPAGAVGQAMSMVQEAAKRAEERADRSERNNGADLEAMRIVMAPMQEQIQALQQQLSAKDSQIIEMISRPPDTSTSDRAFDLMNSQVNGENSRMEAIRQQTESELRQLREHHRDDLKRREDRFQRELEQSRDSAVREMESVRMAHTQSLDAQRLGFESRIDGLKDIQKRLDREITELRTELGELRARKEQGPLQQMQALADLKSGFDTLVPPAAPEEQKSTFERIAETVMSSNLMDGIATRIADASPAAESAAPEMVQVRRKDGKIIEMPRSYVEQAQAERARRQAENEESGGLDADEVARVVTFIEAAIKNGTDPAHFAASARNMVPQGVLLLLRERGVDHFLNKVAKIESGSPLTSVAGRNWVRQVAQFLMAGTTEGSEQEEESASPVES